MVVLYMHRSVSWGFFFHFCTLWYPPNICNVFKFDECSIPFLTLFNVRYIMIFINCLCFFEWIYFNSVSNSKQVPRLLSFDLFDYFLILHTHVNKRMILQSTFQWPHFKRWIIKSNNNFVNFQTWTNNNIFSANCSIWSYGIMSDVLTMIFIPNNREFNDNFYTHQQWFLCVCVWTCP